MRRAAQVRWGLFGRCYRSVGRHSRLVIMITVIKLILVTTVIILIIVILVILVTLVVIIITIIFVRSVGLSV